MRRTRIVLVLSAIAALSLGCSSNSSGGQSSTTAGSLAASLDATQVVNPSTGQPVTVPATLQGASGTFAGHVDRSTDRLTWHLTYQGLGTPQVVIADIHYGAAGHFGRLLVRLCGPCRSSRPAGVTPLTSAEAPALTSGATWVTVLTETYPNGAIRGQITSH